MVVKVASCQDTAVDCRRVILLVQFLLHQVVLFHQVFVYNTDMLIIGSFVLMCDFLIIQVDDIRTLESLSTSL
jgi:hypothetical protein